MTTRKGTPYVTEHRTADGALVITKHPSKSAAHEFGRSLRAQGAEVFAHPADFYRKHINPGWEG